MFHVVLCKLLSSVEGADWVMVVGMDGVLLEAIGNQSSSTSEAVAAEYAIFYRACLRVTAETSGGDIQTIVIHTERGKILLQTLTPDYFLLLGLTSEGNSGMARYEIARARAQLEQELVF